VNPASGIWYLVSGIRHLTSGIWHQKHSMLKSYFKIAFRNLKRHLGFSFINIAGLTLGLTSCILIGLFIWDEKQFDLFIPDQEQIFRVFDERTVPAGTFNVANTPPMFATTLQNDYPEVETTARIIMIQLRALVEAGGKKMYEENAIVTEPGFFKIFPLILKYGSYNKIMDDPSSIILSQKMSERYFGKENSVGKTVLVNRNPLKVTAVLEGNLSKFHLNINYILPLASLQLPAERMNTWQWQQFYTYIKLKKGSNPDLLQKKFQQYLVEKINPTTKGAGFSLLPFLQPLHKIHLYSADFKFDNAIRGNILYVKGLGLIAIFILIIACFNFINLSTAKSLQRAKEVGVRKSIGANRRQLVFQFTGETIILTLISILVSSIIVFMVLPSLNRFTGKEISYNLFANPGFILLLLLGSLLIGVLAGFYPALVLSKFRTVSVLKSSIAKGTPGKGDWLRHGLVVVQFSLSALLIVSAIIVYQQVNYLHHKDLGFNKEEIMFFPMQGDKMFREYDAFKNELQRTPGVSSVSIGYGYPGDIFAGDEIIVPRNGQKETHGATHLLGDYDYIKTLGLQLVSGRDFSKEITTDLNEAYIINETAVKELGFQSPEKALGQQLMWHPWEATNPDSMKIGRVIGVVKDFNYKSLYDKMEVAILHIYPAANWKVAVKIKSENLQSSVSQVKKVWNQFSPEYPMDFKFMDENFEKMYKSEEKLMTLVWIFTAIAIFVGCLGLFGLSAYAAERRTKEIGIRKVLGASVNGIVFMLSKDFLKLVMVALLIASPIAWYFMNQWLQDFPFRIVINWWVFGMSAIVVLLIAILTVSTQAIRAALSNPVKAIKAE
jgi:putative ABC transport system permease protein